MKVVVRFKEASKTSFIEEEKNISTPGLKEWTPASLNSNVSGARYKYPGRNELCNVSRFEVLT